jgi:probable HAF family extracellular repeat protein
MKVGTSRVKSCRTAHLGLALAVFAGPVWAQEQKPEPARYTVTDLGTLGGTYSYAYGLNNAGVVAGGAATATQSGGVYQTAFLWDEDLHMIDLGTLGGPDCRDCSSEAFGPNARGESALISETSESDPNGEDFCGFGTHRQCLGAIWKEGVLTGLPTLPGGNNAQALGLNNRGQVFGYTENGSREKADYCATKYQVLDFEAVIWGPKQDEIQELHPLLGDTVGIALGISDNGQVAGSSGLCSNTTVNLLMGGPHAVLWQKDGSPTDLGNLGGTVNVAASVNNRGEVVGGAQSAKDGKVHAFLWTKQTGLQDLGTLGADVVTAPTWINNHGQVVGLSIDSLGKSRAYLGQGKVMRDLNALIPRGSPWYLQAALSISDAGEIAGYGTIDGNVHAFLATPCERNYADTEGYKDDTEGAAAEGD